MAGMSYFVLAMGFGMLTAIMTCGLLPVGILCGFAGFLLVPVGVLEVVSGALMFIDNENALRVQRITSVIQKLSFLFGGVGSLIVSFVVDGMMRDPEVELFLEHRS